MKTITSTEFFEISGKDAISIVRIKKNVFDFISDIESSSELMGFIKNIAADAEIKALVFYNEPDCVNEINYDKFLKRIMSQTEEAHQLLPPKFDRKDIRFREINILNRFIKQIVNLNKIVVSGIQGSVVTPFVGLALASDLTYACKGAEFIMAHNKYGLHPSGALPFFLSNSLHHAIAMEFQLKGSFTAGEAYEIGLINKVLPEHEFLDSLIRETERFTKYKYCTIQQTKRLTNFSRKSLDDYFDYEAKILNL
jgi:enoyl-CoA hydratase/carnithine racemase